METDLHIGNLLIIEQDPMTSRLLKKILRKMGHNVFTVFNSFKAVQSIKNTLPDLILFDLNLDNSLKFETIRSLKANPETSMIPILAISTFSETGMIVKSLEAGADDFISKPIDKAVLKVRVQSLLKVKAYYDYNKKYQKKLEAEVKKRTWELQKANEKIKELNIDTIFRLSKAAEYKDDTTGKHIYRIGYYGVIMAQKIGFSKEQLDEILYASPMHDIGKIGIPDSILLKPGKLSTKERKIMETHSTIGAKILSGSDSPIIQMAEEIALTHHEKWDGTGYPNGLKKDAIPITGRITAVIDVFDALSSKRPYKDAFPIEKCLKIIKDGRGTHFDPEIVDIFFELEDKIKQIRKEHSD